MSLSVRDRIECLFNGDTSLSFLQRLSYVMGKDPTKSGANGVIAVKGENDRLSILNPLEQAVKRDDLSTVGFFNKLGKLTNSACTAALPLCQSLDMYNTLQNLGAQPEKKFKAELAKTIAENVIHRRAFYNEENLVFLNEHGNLGYVDASGKSIYDAAKTDHERKLWLSCAKDKNIGHELRQAVVRRDVAKVMTMFELDKQIFKETGNHKVDPNAKNDNGVDALAHVLEKEKSCLQKEDAEGVKVYQYIANKLCEEGADLSAKDNLKQNAFQRASEGMYCVLVGACIKLKNFEYLKLAKVSDTVFLSHMQEFQKLTKNEDVLNVLDEMAIDIYQKNGVFTGQRTEHLYDNGVTTLPSLYDLMHNKKRWFDIATPEAIGHELRQAAYDGRFKKVQQMFDLGGVKVDVNATNKDGKDGMTHVLKRYNAYFEKYQKTAPERTGVREKNKMDFTNYENIALFLYQKGAKLDKEDAEGKNVFERIPDQAFQKKLVLAAIEKSDVSGLKAAKKAGYDFDTPEYMDVAKHRNVMEFLVEQRVKNPVTQQEVDAAEMADKRETAGNEFYNDPNQTTFNRFDVLRRAVQGGRK